MAKNSKYLNIEEIRSLLSNQGIEDVDSEIRKIEKQMNSLISSYSKKKDRYQEIYESGECFKDVYLDYDITTLPIWLRENISQALVIGNSKKTVMLPDGRKYQLNNTLNHLSGGEWTFFTNSVLNTTYRTKIKHISLQNKKDVRRCVLCLIFSKIFRKISLL